MITDVIVLSSVAFAVVFAAAWLVSPALRAWIERPKHRFHEAAREYDLAQQRHRPVARLQPPRTVDREG